MGQTRTTMNHIIVIGAGGHAKVCIELLHAMGETVAYCIGGTDAVDTCLGVPVLKGDEHLPRLFAEGYTRVFIAIGSNRLRGKLATMATGLGYTLCNAVSPSAIISPSATLGRGVAIMAGAIINADTTVADLAIINTGATVDHDGKIGYAAHVAPQCALAGNVAIGEYVFLGIGTKVISEIIVGDHAVIGAGSVIIRNIMTWCNGLRHPCKNR